MRLITARLTTRAREERGTVLVFVAGALMLLVLIAVFVVDVGNWFVHKRHLQTQADAAALAGGDSFQQCFGGGGDSAIFAAASEYAGAAGTFDGALYGAAAHNFQVGDPGTISVLFQSPVYAEGGPEADDTQTTAPCSSPYSFDVKATESGVPLFFSGVLDALDPGFRVVVNAHARVQLHPVEAASPELPLAIPNVTPSDVALTFIRKSTGNPLATCSGADKVAGTTCTFRLANPTTSGALSVWSSSSTTTIVPAQPAEILVGIGSNVGACPAPAGATYFCYSPGTDPTDFVQKVVFDPSTPLPIPSGPHTFTRIDVGLLADFQIYDPCAGTSGGDYSCSGDPTRVLRFSSGPGSDNYAFDCGVIADPSHSGPELYQMMRWGCANSYSINELGACPDPANPDPPDCAPINNVGSGDKLGQMRAGLLDRLAPDGVCSANHYPDTSVASDPRVVVLLVTTSSAFNGSGASREVPVLNFAAFYVTGWDGAPDGCDNEPFPGGAGAKAQGDIWGHFVKYVQLGATGDNTKPCDPAGLTPCVPMLTR